MKWKRISSGRYRATTPDGVRYDVECRSDATRVWWVAMAARLIINEPGKRRRAMRWPTVRAAKAACEAIDAGTVVR